jgi:hypothetical protein
MANKKTTKKRKKLKKTSAGIPHKLVANKSAKGKRAAKKKLAKKKPALKKVETKKVGTKTGPNKAGTKKAIGKKTAFAPRSAALKRRVSAKSGSLDTEPLELQDRRSRSAGQSGDLQGLSDVESADSESVDELIEEGNAFEAEVVSGVERAGDNDEKEVRTHEVPEDDVPDEYLDQE